MCFDVYNLTVSGPTAVGIPTHLPAACVVGGHPLDMHFRAGV